MSVRLAAVGCSRVLGACTSRAPSPPQDAGEDLATNLFSGSWHLVDASGSDSCSVGDTSMLLATLTNSLVVDGATDDLAFTYVPVGTNPSCTLTAHLVDDHDAAITSGNCVDSTLIDGGTASATETALTVHLEYTLVNAAGTCSGMFHESYLR